MSLTTTQCAEFNDALGRRPFNWEKAIARDRKPSEYIYTGMYETDTWPTGTGTTHLHERTYVTRPNDPGLWPQFIADPCVGTPCNTRRAYVAHGVDQLRYDEYTQDYQTPVFCIDQLSSVEEGIQKISQIAAGYQELPELISSDFLRVLTLRKAGTAAQGAGLFLVGVADSSGGPVAIDVADNMFSVSKAEAMVKSDNSLLINLNANGALTALGYTTTALLHAALGQMTMNYLMNIQEDLAANGYHNKQWLPAGKFSMTIDAATRRRLLAGNPELAAMYTSADFAKGGSFYSYGVTQGCGDWLWKEDIQQMRFRFRGDMDGKNFAGGALTGAIWVEQVWPFENVAATFGKKPVLSAAWKNAPIALYHAYNRQARKVFVGDITNINDGMKFGMARSFMGKWGWHSPDYFTAVDPATGTACNYQNDKHNMGYWLGEYRFGEETIYPEIERMMFALREPQAYVRVPRTNTALSAPANTADYQSLLAYNNLCNWTASGTYVPGWDFNLPAED